MPMFPYNPAAIMPVRSAMTLLTVCHENLLTPWYASGRVNWPWNEYTKIPYIMYATVISDCAQT